MKRVQLPQTTMEASILCLGTAGFGDTVGPDEAERLMDAFGDAGGNLIDAAGAYAHRATDTPGEGERMIGRWLAKRGDRDKWLLAAKCCRPAEGIAQELEAALERLQTDVVDLYFVQWDNSTLSVEETIDTLNEQVRRGLIRHFGFANWTAPRVKEAGIYAVKSGQEGFVGGQTMWSLAEADPSFVDPALVAMDEELYTLFRDGGITAFPYASSAGGFFSKLADGMPFESLDPNKRKMYGSDINMRRAERVEMLARQSGTPVTSIVLGYLLAQPFTVVPVLGCRTVGQLLDNVRAAETKLTPDQTAYLLLDA